MSQHKYLIVGGGMAADAAVQGIREIDGEGSIGVLSTELHSPYNRPPLSRGLWKGQPVKQIWRQHAVGQATLHLGCTAQSLDAGHHRLTDNQGTVYHYEKLLLATGGTPRRLPGDSPDVIYFRTLDNYYHLRRLVDAWRRFAVIGGGFIGAEIAAALALQHRGHDNLPRAGHRRPHVPRPRWRSSSPVSTSKKGSRSAPAAKRCRSVQGHNGRLLVKTRNLETAAEEEIAAEAVVAGLGIEPDVALARQAGAGDRQRRPRGRRPADQPPQHLRRRRRGRVPQSRPGCLSPRRTRRQRQRPWARWPGSPMAGEPVAYHHLPCFYSDLFELGYEAVGQLNAAARHRLRLEGAVSQGRGLLSSPSGGSAACCCGTFGGGSTPPVS